MLKIRVMYHNFMMKKVKGKSFHLWPNLVVLLSGKINDFLGITPVVTLHYSITNM